MIQQNSLKTVEQYGVGEKVKEEKWRDFTLKVQCIYR
jgi:hypothetical protein